MAIESDVKEFPKLKIPDSEGQLHTRAAACHTQSFLLSKTSILELSKQKNEDLLCGFPHLDLIWPCRGRSHINPGVLNPCHQLLEPSCAGSPKEAAAWRLGAFSFLSPSLAMSVLGHLAICRGDLYPWACLSLPRFSCFTPESFLSGALANYVC